MNPARLGPRHMIHEAVREWAAARRAFLALPPLSFDAKGWVPDQHTAARDAAFARLGAAELRLAEIGSGGC